MSKNRKDDRFEVDRNIDEMESVEQRFENPDFSDEEIRRNLQMTFRDSNHVDLRRKPENVVYEWGREIVRGMADPNGVRDRARYGWSPVPIARHPEFWVDERIDNGVETMRSGIVYSKQREYFI